MQRLLMICILLLNLAAGNSASSQTVDPCQYGCPKEGCPQCDDGGGPIEEGGAEDGNDDSGGDDDSDGSDDEDSSGDLPA